MMAVPGVKIVSALAEHHIPQLCALYREEWWTIRRDPENVKKMLNHSDAVVGLLDSRDRLVGFTRVLSDFTYKALILDVIVSMEWRGRGLGILLLDTVMAHETLKDIAHFELYCQPEMESFYRKWGFQSEGGTLSFMRSLRHE